MAGDNDAADCAAAKAAGKIVECPKPHTIADGLQGRLGSLTWPPLRDLVAQVVTVSEQEIVAAMQLVFERMKVSHKPDEEMQDKTISLSSAHKKREQGCLLV